MADGLRLLLGEPLATSVHVDMANGRVFHDRMPIADRASKEDPPKAKLEALTKLRPGTTQEEVDAKVKEAKDIKERERNDP